jgi:hypothetical protein
MIYKILRHFNIRCSIAYIMHVSYVEFQGIVHILFQNITNLVTGHEHDKSIIEILLDNQQSLR